MTKYQTYARTNYKPGSEIDEMWHDEIQAECRAMNAEAEAAKVKKKATIKKVVENAADAEKEFTGSIVLMASFAGSLPKTKALTPDERARVMDPTIPVESRKKLKGSKPLFGKFDELDALMGYIADARERFKRFGIPFIGDGMTVLMVNVIPDVEEFADCIEKNLPAEVEKMIAAYERARMPDEIEKENPGLSFLYNPNDYPTTEALRARFRFERKWLYPGVPEVLKEVDKARWESERKRTAAVWAEVKKNGMVILRKQLKEMVDRLVESVTPDAEGKRKRFYATTVTNMTEFFEQFSQRNISGDTELEELVERLKKLVSNKDVEDFKDDEVLRESVQRSGQSITKELQSMVVEAEARVISWND